MRTHEVALSGLLLCSSLAAIALTGTGCASTTSHRSTGAYIDDKAVSARVKTALFRDPLVSGFDVHVNTFNGDVQLSGFVDSPEQKDRASEIARSVEGVRMVTNNLDIKPTAVGSPGSTIQGTSPTVTVPEPPPADIPPSRVDDGNRYSEPIVPDASSRADRVNRDLNRNLPPPPVPDTAPRNFAPVRSTAGVPEPAFNSNIEISASNGRATIRGNVRSDAERAEIEHKVREIPGIRSIDDQLQVMTPR